MDDSKILYICNQADPKCKESELCGKVCFRTTKIQYAVNFDKFYGDVYVERSKDDKI